MNRSVLEGLRAELHRRIDESIDAAVAALRVPRRRVLPPLEATPVDEIAQARARKILLHRGLRAGGDE